MQIFVLKADRSVVVEEIAGVKADYAAACIPKGQLFIRTSVQWCDGWRCLHRSGGLTDNAWKAASKVPEEVKLAEMIVN
jgi:hypothetical protein